MAERTWSVDSLPGNNPDREPPAEPNDEHTKSESSHGQVGPDPGVLPERDDIGCPGLEDGSGAELLDALIALVDARIDETLANGRIGETEADELKARAEERLTSLVFDAHNRPARPGSR